MYVCMYVDYIIYVPKVCVDVCACVVLMLCANKIVLLNIICDTRHTLIHNVIVWITVRTL